MATTVDKLETVPQQINGSKLQKIVVIENNNDLDLYCTFNHSCEFILYNAAGKQPNVFRSPQLKSTCSCKSGPCSCVTAGEMYILHECQNTLIQCCIADKSMVLITQDPETCKDIRSIVANEEIVVGIGIKRAVIWETTNPSLGTPITVSLESSPSITTPRDSTALLSDRRLLLVNNNPGGHVFQVWKLPPKDTTKPPNMLCYAECPSKTDTILAMAQNNNYVVTAFKSDFCIWDITKVGCLKSKQQRLPNRMCVTALCIDESFVCVGDNLGNAFIFDFCGILLNSFVDVIAPSDVDIRMIELTRLKELFVKKTNKLLRIGRHIFIATEFGSLKIYDIFATKSECADEIKDIKLPVRDFKIRQNEVVLFCGDDINAQLLYWDPRPQIRHVSDLSELAVIQCTALATGMIFRESDKDSLIMLISRLHKAKNTQLPFIIYQDLFNAIEEYIVAFRSARDKNNSSAIDKAWSVLVHQEAVFTQMLGFLEQKSSSDQMRAFNSTIIKPSVAPTPGTTNMSTEKQISKQETGEINEVLREILDSFETVDMQFSSHVVRFDATCSRGIQDNDKVLPLLDIFMKLKQFVEDTKEIGKQIGLFNGDNPSGEWWENGGVYDI